MKTFIFALLLSSTSAIRFTDFMGPDEGSVSMLAEIKSM